MADNDVKTVITAEDRASSVIKAVSGEFGGMSDSVARVQGAIGGMAAALGVATFAKIISDSVDFAGELDDLSKKTGASVSSLSALRDSAKLAGVDLETAGTGLTKLSRSMLDAVSGSGEAAKIFKALDVSVTDSSGALRDSDAVLLDVAKSIAGLSSSSERAAAAQMLFGRSGAELVPMLLDIADKTELVGTVTAEQAALADKFGDNIVAMQNDTRNAFQVMANESLPVLAAFSEALLEVHGGMDGMRTRAQELANDGKFSAFFEKTAMGAAFVVDGFDGIARVFQIVGTRIGALAAEAATVWEAWKGSGKLSVKDFIATMGSAIDKAKDIERQSLADVNAILGKEQFSDILKRKMAEMNSAAATGGEKIGNSLAAGLAAGADKSKKKLQEVIDVFNNGSFLTRDKATAKFIAEQYKDANEMAAELWQESEKRVEAAKQEAAANEQVVAALNGELGSLSLSSRERSIQAELAKLTATATEDQVKAVRELAGNLFDAKEEAKAQEDAAKRAAQEWQKAADEINRALTDSLMRGFESGAGFAENFKNTMVNMFKTMVLRPIISAIVSPVSGMVATGLGAMGVPGYANAGGSNILGTASNAYSLYNMGSGVVGNTIAGLGSGATTIGGILGATGAEVGIASTYGTAIGSTTTAMIAAQEAGMGAAGAIGELGGALAAIPVWGWVALGALALFGMDDGPENPKFKAKYGGATGTDTPFGKVGIDNSGMGSEFDTQFQTQIKSWADEFAKTLSGDQVDAAKSQLSASTAREFAFPPGDQTAATQVFEQAMVDIASAAYDQIDADLGALARKIGGEALDGVDATKVVTYLSSIRDLNDGLQRASETFPDLGNSLAAFSSMGTDQITQMGQIVGYALLDPVERAQAAADAYAESQKNLWEVYQDQGDSLQTLIAAFDGSTSSTKELAAASVERANTEAQLIQQILSYGPQLTDMFQNTIKGFKYDTLDNQGKYNMIKDEVMGLYDQLPNMFDPTEIKNTAERIDQLTQQGWQLLDPSAKAAKLNEFDAFLNDVDAMVQSRLDEAKTTIQTDHDPAVEGSIANSVASAISAIIPDLLAAAKEIATSASGMPKKIDISVTTDSNTSAEVSVA